MKINFLSDLHLEQGYPPKTVMERKYVPTGDVVLLSGDITNAKNKQVVLDYFAECGVPVLYIPGNHEYYGGDYDTHLDEMCKYYHSKTDNIKVMDDDYIKIGDVHFLGSTLWSSVSPLEAIETIRCIADFRVIGNMTLQKQGEANSLSKGWLDLIMGNIRSKDPEAKIVVFTHFPPSYRAQEEKFKSSGLGSYFYNDLDHLIDKHQPNVWVYGHTHGNISWTQGLTQVVSNQRGYRGEDTNQSFDATRCIEV